MLGSAFVATDAKGEFEIENQLPGKYELRVLLNGYDELVLPVELLGGKTVVITPTLQKIVIGQEVVVTGSKFPEKRIEAPATVERLTEEDLKLSGGTTSYVNALARVKGVDYADNGILDKRVSARGFNTLFNSRMLWMVDSRLAMQPGFGIPLGNQLPTPALDIRSIEVTVGPASALYGANAHTGVINVLTKTPWDDSGVSMALHAGNHNLIDGSLRVAGTFKHRFGYKINAQYFRATDFIPSRSQREFQYGTPGRGPLVFEGDMVPDYTLVQGKVEGYLYAKLGRWYLKGGFGWSYNTTIQANSAGRGHFRGFQVNVQTIQASHPNWFMHISRTGVDGTATQLDTFAKQIQAAGGLAMLTPDQLEMTRYKARVEDQSQMVDSEIQYRNEIWKRRLRVTGGLQLVAGFPKSNGTFLDDAPGRPSIYTVVFGGYAQADVTLLPDRLRAVVALRVDKHTDYDVQISPKGAVVWTMAPGHSLRAGYNRAFKSPTSLENYLNIGGYARGNKTGYTIKDAMGTTVSTIKPLSPEQVDQIDLGYRGGIYNRLFIDLDAYYSFYNNFIGPLTPRSDGMTTFAFFPDGTQPMSVLGTGVLYTYSNFGKAQVAGVNLGIDLWILRNKLLLSAAASYINLVSFTVEMGQKPLLLNVPEWKGRVAITMTDLGVPNSFLRLAGRVQSAYQFQSGFWDSTVFYPNGKLPARFVADLTVGYNFPHGVSLSMNIFNLTNDRGVDTLGAAPGGILMYGELAYHYDGLRY